MSGVISAVQQAFGRFFFFAIAPIFYNMAIIASIYIFKGNIGIVGLAIGALAEPSRGPDARHIYRCLWTWFSLEAVHQLAAG